MMVLTQGVNLYWSGEIEDPVCKTLQKWGMFIEAQLIDARKLRLVYHCTMNLDKNRDLEFEEVGKKQQEVSS